MTRRTVRIDRLVLRGTQIDPLHAERLRVLVGDELAGLLANSEGSPARERLRLPADRTPERLAGPLAQQIATRLPEAGR